MKEMNEHDTIVRIANSLRKLNQSFLQATWKDAEACGVTTIQFMALRMLKQYPMIGLGELSELMHIGESTTSGIVKRLVCAGLILQERPEEDRRAIRLKLSPAGEQLAEKANERIMKRLSSILEIPAEEIEQMLDTHAKIVQVLQKSGEEV
jgi:DNA-binding MarR family transcriptional regulator